MVAGEYSVERYFRPPVTRPRVLTAAGVFSIIAALISSLVSLAILRIANGFLILANTAPATLTPMATATWTHTRYVAPEGLSFEQRQIVIDGLNQARVLSDAQKSQLNDLLANVGRDVIGLSEDSLTSDRVAAYVTSVSDISNDPGGGVARVFVLGSGRLQLSDDSAIFFPNGGSPAMLCGGPTYADSAGQARMPALQIQAVMDRVQVLCNGQMNDAQTHTLELALESFSGQIVKPCDSIPKAVGQIASAQIASDGSLCVTTTTKQITIDPAGQTARSMQSFRNLLSPKASSRVDPRDAHILSLASLGNLIAAVFLLLCGILALRSAPKSRWMYLLLALGKLALVGLTCCLLYKIVLELSGGADTGDQTMALKVATVYAVIGGIYPIVLLILTNLKSVRHFLSPPSQGRVL